MNVLAALCGAVTPGEADAVPGDEAGALAVEVGGAEVPVEVAGAAEVAVAGAVAVLAALDADDAARLADEPHAVTSKAAQASADQPPRTATGRALHESVVHIDVQPLQLRWRLCEPMSPLRRRPRPWGWNHLADGVTTSAEALALAPVGGHGGGSLVAEDHVVFREALGKLAGLGVAQPDTVAGS
jgi:hypothetical protein